MCARPSSTVGERGPAAMPGTLTDRERLYLRGRIIAWMRRWRRVHARCALASRYRLCRELPTFSGGESVPAVRTIASGPPGLPPTADLIVKILSVDDGRAELILTAMAMRMTRLELGISDAERATRQPLPGWARTLACRGAALFALGLNWPFGPPWDATAPNGGQPTAEKPEENPCQRAGSIIECQNQILGEQIAITGTPYQLHYTSERMADHAASNAVRIPLSGPMCPPVWRYRVGSRRCRPPFQPILLENAPDQSYVFSGIKKMRMGATLGAISGHCAHRLRLPGSYGAPSALGMATAARSPPTEHVRK